MYAKNYKIRIYWKYYKNLYNNIEHGTELYPWPNKKTGAATPVFFVLIIVYIVSIQPLDNIMSYYITYDRY